MAHNLQIIMFLKGILILKGIFEMDIIFKNAEQQFLNVIATPAAGDKLRRCLHIKLSKLKGYNFETIKTILEDLLIDHKAQIYITWDFDVFVSAHGISVKSYSILKNRLQDLFQPIGSVPNNTGLFINHYDLFKSRASIKRLLEHKLKERQLMDKTKKIAALSKTSAVQQEQKLDTVLQSDLIKSVKQRRDSRENPEVLIIEDDNFMRTLLTTSLKEKYITTAAENGYNGITDYISRAPDVLFLDLGLPDINGQEILNRILTLDPDAHVIIISGHRDQKNILTALEAGAKGYIAKPFTKEKLNQYIQKSPIVNKTLQTA